MLTNTVLKKVQVKRVGDNDKTSLGVIYLDGIAKCGSVEDREQKGDKVRGETRVSNGLYKFGLRKAGKHYDRYVARYNDPSSKHFKGKNWYRGTPCVYTDIVNGYKWVLNCPDGKIFTYIMWHTGNTHQHTEGCLLPNYVIDFLNDKGSRSRQAFEDVYPIIRDGIEASCKVDAWNNNYIDIEYSDVEDGK